MNNPNNINNRYFLTPKGETLYSNTGVVEFPVTGGTKATAVNLEAILKRCGAANIKWAKFKDRRSKKQPKLVTFNLSDDNTFGLISKELNSRCLPLVVFKHWDSNK